MAKSKPALERLLCLLIDLDGSSRWSLAVLDATDEPLTVMQVSRAIDATFGETVGKEALRSTLQRSRPVRDGRIVRIKFKPYDRYLSTNAGTLS